MAYFDQAFNQRDLVNNAKAEIPANVTLLVGTGVSGTIAVSVLAYALGLRFAVVRKPDDKMTHSCDRIEGDVRSGDVWAFVDDFLSTGATRTRVREEFEKAYAHRGVTFAGSYLYQPWNSPPWVGPDHKAKFAQ